MESEFIHETKIIDKTEKEKISELVESIMKTREDLRQAHYNFEFAENDLVDYYSYQIKANQSKLDHLTRLAKINNLNLETVNNVFRSLNKNENKAG